MGRIKRYGATFFFGSDLKVTINTKTTPASSKYQPIEAALKKCR